MKIHNVVLDNDVLDSLDMNAVSKFLMWPAYIEYMLWPSGKSYHRLLAYLSIQYDNATLLDIGTLYGSSALSLSYNPTNKVVSFDAMNVRAISPDLDRNIEFIVDGYFLREKYIELIHSASLMFLDVDPHNGIFEAEIYAALRSIGWKGWMVMDDIYREEMVPMWNTIADEKYDITEFGQSSNGTGLVIFGD